MKTYRLDEMIGGWFVGDFDLSVLRCSAAEVAVKRFRKGECFPPHYHKLGEEITVIVSGHVRINGTDYRENDIILQHRMECTDFTVIEDTVIVVVKLPSIPGDKYEPDERRSIC